MSDLFKELIPSIMKTGVYQPDDSGYVPFVVNKALAYHIDTILYANEMNRYPKLEKKLQYDYLFHSVKKRSRPFVPWIKKEKSEVIDAIKTYYDCSTTKAHQAASILTDEQKQIIVEKTTIGGIK